MDAASLVLRARSGIGKNTRYSSPGVTPPLSASTWPETGGKCDCTGFLAWCLRISRKVNHPMYAKVNGGWFETTGIHADIEASWGYFEKLDIPRVGSFVVYPDTGGVDGHIGLISEVSGQSGMAGIVSVIHCSNGSWKKHGDAIRETDASVWLTKSASVLGWYVGVID